MTEDDHDDSPGRILVVDDDPVICGFLANLLVARADSRSRKRPTLPSR